MRPRSGVGDAITPTHPIANAVAEAHCVGVLQQAHTESGTTTVWLRRTRHSQQPALRCVSILVRPEAGVTINRSLGSDESMEIPRWLSRRRGGATVRAEGQADLQACFASVSRLVAAVAAWRGGHREPSLRFGPGDGVRRVRRPSILRVLGRIIADLHTLGGLPPRPAEGSEDEDAEARRVCHWKRLVETEPQPRRLTMREQRALLRALLDERRTVGNDSVCCAASSHYPPLNEALRLGRRRLLDLLRKTAVAEITGTDSISPRRTMRRSTPPKRAWGKRMTPENRGPREDLLPDRGVTETVRRGPTVAVSVLMPRPVVPRPSARRLLSDGENGC